MNNDHISDIQTASNILVLCPHPDDFDVAGVTLKQLHKKGATIHVAIAPTFSGILESFYKQPASSSEMIKTREEEQRQSLLYFGLAESAFEFLPHSCDLDDNGEWKYSEANKSLIEKCLLHHVPELVFIPHPNDNNPAHSAMYKMVKECIDRHHLAVHLMMQMDPKTKGMSLDFVTEISDREADWKKQLLSHHKTQDHRNQTTRGISLADRVLSINQEAAKTCQSRSSFAEAFEIESHTDRFPVEVIEEFTPDFSAAILRLIPQLADIPLPSEDHIKKLLTSPSSETLVMRDLDNGKIIGTVTLCEYLIPTGRRVWIEDVIVDQEYRGRHLAVKLMLAAERHAQQKGADSINLTSSPFREAANQLYKKIGYELRQTNSYRKDLTTEQ